MRIQLSDPAYTEDLTHFLAGEGCLVEQLDEDEVEASILGSLHHDRLKLELDLLLAAWESGRANGARACLVE
jgi:hypothetical protein